MLRVLLEQWIRAKYEREEFIHVDRQTYITNKIEGYLMKKARDENKYYERKFVVSENSLMYYNKVCVCFGLSLGLSFLRTLPGVLSLCFTYIPDTLSLTRTFSRDMATAESIPYFSTIISPYSVPHVPTLSLCPHTVIL